MVIAVLEVCDFCKSLAIFFFLINKQKYKLFNNF